MIASPSRSHADELIRDATAKDIARIAQLHARYIPGGVTDLGEPFLRLFYLGALSRPNAILRVAENTGAVTGFYLACTGHSFPFLRAMLASPALALALLLADPRIAWRILRMRLATPRPTTMVFDALWIYQVVDRRRDGVDLATLFFHDLYAILLRLGVRDFGGTLNSRNTFSKRYQARLGGQFIEEFSREGETFLVVRHVISENAGREPGAGRP